MSLLNRLVTTNTNPERHLPIDVQISSASLVDAINSLPSTSTAGTNQKRKRGRPPIEKSLRGKSACTRVLKPGQLYCMYCKRVTERDEGMEPPKQPATLNKWLQSLSCGDPHLYSMMLSRSRRPHLLCRLHYDTNRTALYKLGVLSPVPDYNKNSGPAAKKPLSCSLTSSPTSSNC